MALKRAAKASKKRGVGQATPSPTLQKEIPSYLREFLSRCIREFDVNWVCEQISQTKTVPAWYRSILTRMLVGWAIWPDNSSVRKSLAWHHINDQLHIEAMYGDKTERSYYHRVAKQFVDGSSKYRHIYRPLGGFNSKQHHSIAELRERFSTYALDAKSCLQVIDVIAFLTSRKVKFTLDNAKLILDAIKSDFGKADPVKPFSKEGSYKNREPIGKKNFEKLWVYCQPSIEFIAALYCISVKTTTLRKKKNRDAYLKGESPNALDAIIMRSVETLPFESPDFQRELIGRAKYFSKFLSSRKKIDGHKRFPTLIPEIPSELTIFSGEVLFNYAD